MGAMWAMAVATLAALPLIGKLTGPSPAVTHHSDDSRLGPAVLEALRNPLLVVARRFLYLRVSSRFPGNPPAGRSESVRPTAQCGQLVARHHRLGKRIPGSLYAGSAWPVIAAKYVLAVMYASRALLIVGYLWMPRTEWTYYLFAAGLGFTWLAGSTYCGDCREAIGTRYLATLFGLLTLLSHQIGGFLGAWLGGVTISKFGDSPGCGTPTSYLPSWLHWLICPLREAVVVAPQRNRPVAAES